MLPEKERGVGPLTITEALARYRRELKPARAAQYVAMVEKYLRWGGSNTDAALQAYCLHLEAEGYASGTINLVSRTVAAFYRHLRIPAPRYRYPHQASAERRPSVTPAWVRQWIHTARAQETPTADAQLVWASTLYGLRVGELAFLTSDRVDSERRRIYLQAEKHSDSRWCWMPPAPITLHPWPRRSIDACYQAWERTTAAAGLPVPKGMGYHAIRRSLAEALMAAQCNPLAVVRFLRWSTHDPGLGELPRYVRPSARIGPDGEETASDQDPASQGFDAAVWERHPFLPFWLEPLDSIAQ